MRLLISPPSSQVSRRWSAGPASCTARFASPCAVPPARPYCPTGNYSVSYHEGVENHTTTELASLDGDLLLAMSSMMARAFHHDQLLAWLVPNARIRPARLRDFFEREIRYRLNGTAIPLVVGPNGLALWHPPGSIPSQQHPFSTAGAHLSLTRRRAMVARSIRRELVRRRPTEAHWRLSHLAVDPGIQRVGIGQALLAAGIERAGRAGVGVYLENTNPQVLPFLGTMGFGQVGIIRTRRAPPVWLMWRPGV